MYYPQHQVIFIAINKCGSSSILKALNKELYEPDVDEMWQLQGVNKVRRVQENLKHAQAYFYQQQLGAGVFDKCLVFSQVRNPWDKMVSDFHFRCASPEKEELWRQQRKWFIEHGLDKPTDSPAPELFTDYVKALQARELQPHGSWGNVSRARGLDDASKENINQLDGLTDLDGNLIVDKVYRFEDLSENWPEIQALIKDKTGKTMGDLPHLHKTKRSSYRQYYNDETAEIVRRLFARDIDYFDYSF